MGKNISLKNISAEMMARVTGKQPPVAKSTAAPLPPAAPAAKSAKVTRPLPPGVIAPTAADLTEVERIALESIKWNEGQGIPSNLADIMAEVRESRENANIPLAADPRRPALHVDVKDEADLSEAERADVQRKIQETLASASSNASAQKETAGMPASVKQALHEATRPDRVSVIDDREAKPVESTATPSVPDVPSTGAEASTECPHCGHDTTVTDVPEPPYSDKIAFLQAILGEKTFSKTYPLFGGNVIVTFRSLTVKELDAVFRQVFRERDLGTIQTSMDFAERVNRYRLYLQLSAIKSDSFSHEFPDGFTPETNAGVTSYYELPSDIPDGETGLRDVEKMMLNGVLKTESMIRAVTNAVRQFNRLISKMEAMADNSDFWNPTEGQS